MTIQRDPYTNRGQVLTSEGQALVLSESHTEARHHSELGTVFMIASGFVTHSNTADTFTGVVYFQNDSTTKDVHIGYMRSCNEVPGKWQLKKNVTSLSSSATLIPSNMNEGSAKVFNGTVEGGNATTSVFTGGDIVAQWIQNGPGHSDPDWSGAFLLGPGDSMGLEFAPFATASSNEVCSTIQIWQVDPS